MNVSWREQFYYQVGSMISQGLDVRTSIGIFAEELTKETLRIEVGQVLHCLDEGQSFSEALKSLKGITPTEVVNVEIAEETGTLAHVLSELADYLRTRKEQKRLVISALAYPSLVIFTAIVTILFMLAFIVPMFQSVFDRVGGELPWLTQSIVDLSDGLTNNLTSVFVLFLISIFGFWLFRKNRTLGIFIDQISLKIPFLGHSILVSHLARFSGAMHLLLSNGKSLTSALDHLSQLDLSYNILVSVEAAHRGIIEGEFLYEALGRHRIFPRRMISMIRVGEESGSLDKTFKMLQNQYQAEQRYQTSIIGSVLEPALIIIVGLIVGIILISMYLPMFQMSTVIQ